MKHCWLDFVVTFHNKTKLLSLSVSPTPRQQSVYNDVVVLVNKISFKSWNIL